MPEPTPEQKAQLEDLNKRVKAFNAELIPLLGKYKLGLGAVPAITRDGRVVAGLQIVDDSKPKELPKEPDEKIVPPEEGLQSSEN